MLWQPLYIILVLLTWIFLRKRNQTVGFLAENTATNEDNMRIQILLLLMAVFNLMGCKEKGTLPYQEADYTIANMDRQIEEH